MEHVPVEEKEKATESSASESNEADPEPEHLAKLALMQNSPMGRRLFLTGGVSTLLLVLVNSGSARLPIMLSWFFASCVVWVIVTKVSGLDLWEVWRDLTGDRERIAKKKKKEGDDEYKYELALAGIPCFLLIALMNNDLHMTTLIALVSLTCFAALVVSGVRAYLNTPLKKEEVAPAQEKKDK